MVWISRYNESMGIFVESAGMTKNEFEILKFVLVFFVEELQFNLIW